ncbi:uncharacterized protein LOC112341655 [Selaginella moellendorffii]|uniref:uncharacterized protein LOC112341655 n=1 Tax=Selaginella moellendorffii TaxID=88036 RepID=UPI000D1C97B5|nr:uncharacterized protein LOC112341655 [Selaginella moellendorffii]|eukprot:XP_024517962.1 uncharacterized protein LOC112341655 [Selaginella moellendorffii]
MTNLLPNKLLRSFATNRACSWSSSLESVVRTRNETIAARFTCVLSSTIFLFSDLFNAVVIKLCSLDSMRRYPISSWTVETIPGFIRWSMEDRHATDGYDAVVLSSHKYVGGPRTPGLLCINKKLYKLKDHAPSRTGGGVVTTKRRRAMASVLKLLLALDDVRAWDFAAVDRLKETLGKNVGVMLIMNASHLLKL